VPYLDAEGVLNALATLAKPHCASIVRYLTDHGESYWGELQRGTGIPTGSISRALSELEDQGLIAGDPARGERRGRSARYRVVAGRITEVLELARQQLLD